MEKGSYISDIGGKGNSIYQGKDLFKFADFAKKLDIKQIEEVAKKFKMTPQQRRDFGDYVESLKDLVPNNKNFTWSELLEIAKEFLGE